MKASSNKSADLEAHTACYHFLETELSRRDNLKILKMYLHKADRSKHTLDLVKVDVLHTDF